MSDVSPWRSGSTEIVPASAKTPAEIAGYARQLTLREQRQVVSAFEDENFEMGAGFLWSRAMSALKKRLEALGSDFIGEMLDRPDIGPDASLVRALTDYDAVRLAEELGMFTATQSMRLRNAMEVVSHFSEPPADGDTDSREMLEHEAIAVFRACVQASLGQEDLGGALEFADFRNRLESEQLQSDDPQIRMLAGSSEFFVSTTVRVLMALAKTTEGAQLDHALGNVNVVLPAVWGRLPDPDRWLVGRTYAELHASGKRPRISGLKRALLRVSGFDYVPEDLRSRSFIEAARRVEDVHNAMDNFYNEPAAMRELASLGTVVPIPAFPQVMTALLSVRMGNRYGVSWAAQTDADAMLEGVTQDRWRYYLDECLTRDAGILAKFRHSKPQQRWVEDVVARYSVSEAEPKTVFGRQVLEASVSGRVQRLEELMDRAYSKAVGS